MSHIIGHGRYARESYPKATNVGVNAQELIRFYGNMQAGLAGETFSPVAWGGQESGLLPNNPPGGLDESVFLIPMPAGKLGNASIVVVKDVTGGAITGDTPIKIQWRGLLGAAPTFSFPGTALGAEQDFFTPSAIPAQPATLGLSFDFSDVIIPAGGGLIYADLSIPEDLDIPASSFIQFFFEVNAP